MDGGVGADNARELVAAGADALVMGAAVFGAADPGGGGTPRPRARRVTEDEIIAALRPLTKGIGDDAALWQPSRSHRSAISSDMLVEGVDFTRDAMTLEDAGWRAMAANVSDLAATGARPVLATVALGLPPALEMAEVLELYGGLAACAADAKLSIVGGDLSRSAALTIAITVVGEVRASDAKSRAGGRPGDVLAVTGALGAARAGFELTRPALADRRRG